MRRDKAACLDKIRKCGVVPVATVDDSGKAADLARAMLRGGIDVIEVTFRTAAAADSIRAISESCPDMLVGAGTVLTLDQCRQAVDCGAGFIVSPGFDPEIVSWCLEREIPVVPGCVTPTEITAAMRMGLEVVKFFPCDILGGLAALKTLSGPFPNIRFIPTSGINMDNVASFVRSPYVFAAGGSWPCPKDAIRSGDFERITALCAETRRRVLGFELAHIGINCDGAEASREICMAFENAFGFPYKPGKGSSDFASGQIEVKKAGGKGRCGHLAIATNSIDCAIGEMERRGIPMSEERVYEQGKLIAAWLRDEIGGFAVHLMIKR